ncbi:MAG: hypothetical protein ABII74_07170 [Elusimicrobiota bacterium]
MKNYYSENKRYHDPSGEQNINSFHNYSPLSAINPMIINLRKIGQKKRLEMQNFREGRKIMKKLKNGLEFFRAMFFVPVRVKNNSSKNYQKQYSAAKKNIQSQFFHLSSSLSIIYAAVNAPIKKINPPIKTPILNPCEEINCPITNAANVSFPTSYSAFDRLARFIH